MAFTGKVGSPDSQLGNIVPGFGAVPSNIASDTLALSHDASVTIRYTRNVEASSSLLSMTQTVGLGISNNKPVSQALAITDFARIYRQISTSITDTLSLSDDAERGVLFADASQSLNLTDEAIIQRLPSFTVKDTISFSQFARITTRNLRASALFSVMDTATAIGPRYVSAADTGHTELVFDPATFTLVSHTIGLVSDSASVQTSHNNVPAHSFISLADYAVGANVKASGTDEDATNTLTLSDTAQLSVVGEAANALSLTDAASASSGLPLSNLLTVSDAATLTVSRAAAGLSNTLDLGDAVRFVVEHTGVQFKYAPFIGSTTDPNAPTPPPPSLPDASELTGFRLLYPSSGSPTDELVLRAPNLGDIDRLAFDRINRETRGGTLVVFADPMWPKVETLVLQFSVLKKTEAYALLDFMENHLGRKVRLIDWEDRAWTGYIVNTEDPIVEDRRDSFTASFEFEGQRE